MSGFRPLTRNYSIYKTIFFYVTISLERTGFRPLTRNYSIYVAALYICAAILIKKFSSPYEELLYIFTKKSLSSGLLATSFRPLTRNYSIYNSILDIRGKQF